MDSAPRNWKCRNCGRANRTEVGLDGTAKCEHCAYVMSIQPSRLKGGAVLPSSYPTRPPARS
jgi:DNA-directed RNA polymerase subunit RPC12/RpoP